jgi:uncharacterized protein (TIGR03437 family)
MRVFLLFWFFTSILSGAYSDLIATSDGNAVYFKVQTGPVTYSWYVARAGTPGPDVTAVNEPLADVDGSGTVLASAFTAARSCGFAGSSCWLADPCHASFQLEGPGFKYSNTYDTFTRLSRSSEFAWISQRNCTSLGPQPVTILNGLYQSSSLKLVAAQGAAGAANQRTGRLTVTDSGQLLTLAGPQLGWLDSSGAHLIRNVNGAFEAVTDRQGKNVVYVEAPYGELHWVGGTDWLAAQDLDLNLMGSAPALTEDGGSLLFLAADGSLQTCQRAAGTLRSLGADRYQSFTVGGSAVFAVTLDGRLVRLDLGSGDASVWLSPFIEISAVDAPDIVPNWCTYICYGQTEYDKIMSAGMMVILEGYKLGGTGWRVRIAGVEAPLVPLSDTAAWFQVPDGPTGENPLQVYRPGFPISYLIKTQTRILAIACLGALSQDFSHLIAADHPAVPGEIVHIFLTGLEGAEPVANGVPNPTDHLVGIANPPPLYDPGALEQLFFGLAPGLVGIQQLDVRVQHAASGLFTPPGVSADFTPTWNCAAPPVAAP